MVIKKNINVPYLFRISYLLLDKQHTGAARKTAGRRKQWGRSRRQQDEESSGGKGDASRTKRAVGGKPPTARRWSRRLARCPIHTFTYLCVSSRILAAIVALRYGKTCEDADSKARDKARPAPTSGPALRRHLHIKTSPIAALATAQWPSLCGPPATRQR